MNDSTVKTLIDGAIKAAIQAGKSILEIYNSDDFDVTLKSDQSPLTRADKQAHQIIVSYLQSSQLPILSEEGEAIPYAERKVWEQFWLVDPLDGTKEFIKRNGEFTVNIALIENQVPIAGVVYVPVTGDLYVNNGSGSYRSKVINEEIDETSIAKLPISVERMEYIIVGSRSHMSEETQTYIDQLDSAGKPKIMLSKGSSLKICLVAEGNADIYPRLGPTMEWDTAAGHAIALGAGKKIVVYNTSAPLLYNRENLLNPYFIVS